jgi:hypothetical protein
MFNVQCLEIDEIELENVIKGGHKVNKHVDFGPITHLMNGGNFGGMT